MLWLISLGVSIGRGFQLPICPEPQTTHGGGEPPPDTKLYSLSTGYYSHVHALLYFIIVIPSMQWLSLAIPSQKLMHTQ